MCVKGSLVLVLVRDWTQCLPQGVGHAAGTHGWLPQKTGWPGIRRGGVDGYNLHSPPDCGAPTTCRLYPFGAKRMISSSSSVYSPFSDRVGLPPHNTPFLRVLMKSIGAIFLRPDTLPDVNHMRGMQYQIVLHIIFLTEITNTVVQIFVYNFYTKQQH